jgi:AAA domain
LPANEWAVSLGLLSKNAMNIRDLELANDTIGCFSFSQGALGIHDEGCPVLLAPLPGSGSASVTLNNGHSVLCEPLAQSARTLVERAGREGLAFLTVLLAVERERVTLQGLSFHSVTTFSPERPLTIVVAERVSDDIPATARKNLLSFLAEEFLLGDVAFALSGTRSGDSDFTLIGPRFLLSVTLRRTGLPQAMRIRRKRKGWVPSAPVRLFRGAVGFRDATLTSALGSLRGEDVETTATRGEYLGSWDVYNELEQHHLTLRLNEFGLVRYTRYERRRINDRVAFEFELVDPTPADLRAQAIDLEATGERPAVDETSGAISAPSDTVFVGETYSDGEHRRRLTTLLSPDSDFQAPPKQGYLLPSVRGTKAQVDRRARALNRILDGDTPLVTLPVLIENPAEAAYADVRYRQPRSRQTDAILHGTPTANQIEALDVALNSPDIALIQGPPGTGKTSVIKALLARWTYLRDQVSRESADERALPQVLICSAQHDAVDNVVEGFDIGGLPAFRLGGRRGRSAADSRLRSLEEWSAERRRGCEDKIKQLGATPFRQLARDIDRLIAQWHQIRGGDDTAVLRDILALAQPHISPAQSLQLMNAVSRRSVDRQPPTTALEDTSAERLDNRLRGLVAAQRTNPKEFLHDGAFQADRLLHFLEGTGAGLAIPVPEAVREAAAFDALVSHSAAPRVVANLKDAITAMQPSRCGNFDGTESAGDNEVLAVLLSDISRSVHERASTGRDGVVEALAAYAEELDDLKAVSSMIEKYSAVVAATCQQSVIQDYARRDYDLVVVDEAARVNPLDLLIPMSHARKIVLVGDHKQLPHMLEPEVLESFLKSGRGRQEFVRESLFQRLFERFEQIQRAGGPRRVATLSDDFRMHPVISGFVSAAFYDGHVVPKRTEEERRHTLGLFGNQPVAWVDVPWSRGGESGPPVHSRSRTAEVEVVTDELRKILRASADFRVGVITFYEQQATRIRVLLDQFPVELKGRVQVGTVDAFQGREFDVVLLSTVRSNRTRHDLRGRIGFLDSPNRLCVALSRAQRLLVVIGDADTVAGTTAAPAVKPLRDFLTLCQARGSYEHRG